MNNINGFLWQANFICLLNEMYKPLKLLHDTEISYKKLDGNACLFNTWKYNIMKNNGLVDTVHCTAY